MPVQRVLRLMVQRSAAAPPAHTHTQLLIKHGVQQAQLDADLTFQLDEVAKLRNADQETYAVLLAAAHQELDALKGKHVLGQHIGAELDANTHTPRASVSTACVDTARAPVEEEQVPGTPPSVSPVGALFAATKPLNELQQATRSVLDAATPLPYVWLTWW